MDRGLALQLLLTIPPLLVAVVLHEVAHGYVAERFGDPTARRLGRITLNPIKHIDPFFTIILPTMLILSGSPIVFGGAKPVPVNWSNFSNPRRDMMWVALAGPATNVVLAAVCYFILLGFSSVALFAGSPSDSAFLGIGVAWLVFGLLINLSLAAFNLIPIPPLDGGRIAVGLLPVPLARALARLEPFGILLLFGLLMTGVFDHVFEGILKLVEGLLGGLPFPGAG